MNDNTYKLVASIVRLEDYYSGMDAGHTHKRKLIGRIIDDLRTLVIL